MLEISDLVVFRGAIRVLKGVSLEVGKGEIVTIVGPNGAGKTTLLRTVSGLHRASSGSIRFARREIGKLEPHEIVRAGITQVLQGRQIFDRMTVLQNLRMELTTGVSNRALTSNPISKRSIRIFRSCTNAVISKGAR